MRTHCGRTGSAFLAALMFTVLSLLPTSLAEAATTASTTAGPVAVEYPSDTDPGVIEMLSGFSVLAKDHPDVLAANSDTAVRINTSASSAQQTRAVTDAVEDMSVTMSDGLGSTVGRLYREARAEGELPKTTALIGTEQEGVYPRWASAEKAKAYFGYTRPFIALPERIVKHPDPTGKVYSVAWLSFPSGHSERAYRQALVLATFLPELAPQILARASEAADNRVVLGVHYPLDVIGGRMVATRMVAARWSDPKFRPVVEAARTELRTVLARRCGMPLAECIATDTPYMDTARAKRVFEERLTYGLPAVGKEGVAEVVPPGAEDLLLTSFPELGASQRRSVLELTAQASGHALDLSGTGVAASSAGWERLDVLAAMEAHPVVAPDGTVSIGSTSVGPSSASGAEGSGVITATDFARRHVVEISAVVTVVAILIVFLVTLHRRRRVDAGEPGVRRHRDRR